MDILLSFTRCSSQSAVLVIAVAISSITGPVSFASYGWVKDRTFHILKLRLMVVDADQRKPGAHEQAPAPTTACSGAVDHA
jgi:lipopolysaccharide/colanic/teichoic acid biosynthesis glycosyltransferase